MTWRHGRWPAGVTTASPGGSGPFSFRIRRQSSRMAGPPVRWMAPSTPPPPIRLELAALTMASTPSRVMSPRTSSTRVRPKTRVVTGPARTRGRARGAGGEGARGAHAPPRPDPGLPRADSVPGTVGHQELEPVPGRDLDGLAGLGISPNPGLVAPDDQLPDPRDRETVLGLLVGQRRQGLQVGRRGLLIQIHVLG